MTNHLLLVDYNAIGEAIPDEEDARVRQIVYELKIRSFSVDQIPPFLRWFIESITNEHSTASDCEWKQARIWYLQNIERALKGIPINPVYDSNNGIIEAILEKYNFMIDYLVDIYNMCPDRHARWTNTKRISSIFSDMLLFDYFLKEWTESDYHLSQRLHDQMSDSDSDTTYDPWDIRGNNNLIC